MRFYKDSNKIYLDSAKACPLYFELLKWRNNYEKKSSVDKSEIRKDHETVVENVRVEVSSFFNVKNGDVLFNTSFSQSFNSLINELKSLLSSINLKKDIDCFSTSSIELFSLASSYSAKEYLLAVVAEKLLFLLNFNSLF